MQYEWEFQIYSDSQPGKAKVFNIENTNEGWQKDDGGEFIKVLADGTKHEYFTFTQVQKP